MKNHYEIQGEVTVILLHRKDGSVLKTLIDTSDLEKAKAFPFTWFANWAPETRSFYCDGNFYLPGGASRHIRLHRWLSNCSENVVVDHSDSDTLNNCRENLRVVTQAENMQNRIGANRNSRSGVRGVYWEPKRGQWRAVITLKGKHKHIGRFSHISEAETAVKKAFAMYMPFSKESKEALVI
jgi:hypothetical protein